MTKIDLGVDVWPLLWLLPDHVTQKLLEFVHKKTLESIGMLAREAPGCFII